MKLPRHTRNALLVTKRIEELGIPFGIQQKIGSFAVTWGMFESYLERVVWILQDEQVKGNRPSTDKTYAHKWVEILEKGHVSISEVGNEVLSIAAKAAKNLMSYRHSLFHGYLVPLGDTVMFIRNPRWDGEVRNRELGDAHIDENIIDLAIDAAWVLFSIVMAVIRFANDGNSAKIEELMSEAKRIKSNTTEIRYIAASMEHEKN